MRRDSEFWESEVAYCISALNNGPGRNFSFSLETFLRYLQMQAAAAFRDDQEAAGLRLSELAAEIIARLDSES